MSETLLGIDIGNTKIAFGLLKAGDVTYRVEIPTHAQSYEIPVDLGSVQRCRIASVVPSATPRLLSILRERSSSLEIEVIRSERIQIETRVSNVSQVGVDRLLAALAGYHESPRASSGGCIVINAGTATTIECISASGVYLGGSIGLGLGKTLEELHEQTAQLPLVELAAPLQAVGTDTHSAIRSGVVLGGLYGIQGLIRRMSAEALGGADPFVCVTGGAGEVVAEFLSCHYDPNLVLKGLALARGPRDASNRIS